MRTFGGVVTMLVAAMLAIPVVGAQQPPAQPRTDEPLAIARILAAKYPAQPIMSYIPALSWSNSLRLAEMTGEGQWREKPEREMQRFIDDRSLAQAERRLTSLAGGLAFHRAMRAAMTRLRRRVGSMRPSSARIAGHSRERIFRNSTVACQCSA